MKLFLFLLCLCAFLFSCKKLPSEISDANADKSAGMITNAAPSSNTYIDSFDAVNHDGDTTEKMTLLGNQLTNPYLVPNMQQAYANLGITNVSVTVTNKYVRFKPTIDQLSYLDSFMDAKGLDLFDAPLDYQILLEGDYYQDPSIPDSLPTWQYAVVPAVFTYPTSVQYETLAQIHIPGDNYTAVETEAERLASLGGGGANASTDGGGETNGLDCGTGYHYDYETHTCVTNDCPSGYSWNGSACVPNQTAPPPPAPDAAVPAGRITLDETQQLTTGTDPGTTRNTVYNTTNRLTPLQNARVVARRWFKVERGYTNNQGQFQLTKRFKNKARINIKFKNSDAVIRCLRGVRVWNTFTPLNKVIGVYSTNKNNVVYNFAQWGERHAKGNQYWVGGTVHNALQEYKVFATGQTIGLPPANLNILITNWSSDGATPMLHKRASDNFPKEAIEAFVATDVSSIAGGIAVLAIIVKHQIDITIGYRIDAGNSYFSKTSDDLKELTYHELTHSTHYNSLGNSWYGQFANAEVYEIVTHPFGGPNSPYGNGADSYAPIIALGESWAEYVGQFMSDLKYGTTSSGVREQTDRDFYNTTTITGGVTTTISSHINALEKFDPNYANDPIRWIPFGLYQDLRDEATETTPVIDQVSGYYTNGIMFNAFGSSITTMQGYRTNLLNLNTSTNAQATQVTDLFTRYHY